jgi:hypothetical protein
MTFLGASDIPTRGVEDHRKVLNGLDVKLSEAKARRDAVLADIRKTNAAVDAGDRQARLKLPALNKQDAAAGRLILSLEAELGEAKKRLGMAMNQAATAAAKRAQSDAPVVMGDRLFEVETPDGRKVRHRYATADGLQKMLQPGYRVIAEVFGAGIDGKGGFVVPIGSSAPTIMTSLLDAFGDQLLAWLASHGIKTVTEGAKANGRV